jgi:hypothetical protein
VVQTADFKLVVCTTLRHPCDTLGLEQHFIGLRLDGVAHIDVARDDELALLPVCVVALDFF